MWAKPILAHILVMMLIMFKMLIMWASWLTFWLRSSWLRAQVREGKAVNIVGTARCSDWTSKPWSILYIETINLGITILYVISGDRSPGFSPFKLHGVYWARRAPVDSMGPLVLFLLLSGGAVEKQDSGQPVPLPKYARDHLQRPSPYPGRVGSLHSSIQFLHS